MGADPTSLKEVFQTLSPKQASLLIGTVISADPLKIEMVNDSKHIITSEITVVPKHLTEHKVKVSMSGGTVHGSTGTADGHSHGISSFSVEDAILTVKNALEVGDMVHILALQSEKKYFILDRV